ncbi:MAG: enoyl-CoA hydratase-related protein [Candidatus Eremiobacterota bacterium]
MGMGSSTNKYANLILCFQEHLAVMIVNRPDKLNALNSGVLDDIERALDEIEADPKWRVLLITGAPPLPPRDEKARALPEAFVAGADIKELKDLGPRQGKKASERGQKLLRRLEKSHLFTIAGINGFALGGGLELALACDVRVAADTALLGLPEVTLGIIPGYGGTQRLPRLVGRGQAMMMIATGSKLNAAQALNIGLVNLVVPRDQLLVVCQGIATEIAKVGPLAVAAAKRAVDQGMQVGLDQGLAIEAKEFGKLCSTEDRTEGMSAFLEKRAPAFAGH